jgi:hypothetical protein
VSPIGSPTMYRSSVSAQILFTFTGRALNFD